MSGVRMIHFSKDLMEIHSNPPILYYGFKLNETFFFAVNKLPKSHSQLHNSPIYTTYMYMCVYVKQRPNKNVHSNKY